MKKTLISITILWEALLLAAGPARAQAPVSGSDCQAEQTAMRQLGAPDAVVRDALLPPGVESASVGALEEMRDSTKANLSVAEARSLKEDAATFRLWICAYDAAIASRQGPNLKRNDAPLTAASAAGGNGASSANADSGGMRAAASATGRAVGQNRGKGGNPDWMYDDADHGQCVTVEAVGSNTGSGLAYGHYKLINNCGYPIKLIGCTTPDRADGTPSPNYDLHQDGNKCPGMGWGAGTLAANEVQPAREWFEFNRLKWDMRVCRDGWDFVGPDGRFPSDILGTEYGCRTRRPSE